MKGLNWWGKTNSYYTTKQLEHKKWEGDKFKLNQCFNIIKIKQKWKNPKQCNVLTYNMSYLKRKKKTQKGI